MKEFLMKIKLVDNLTTELEIEKSEFVNKFREYVDEGSTGLFSDSFDAFSSSRNEYKGHVGEEGFKIKRRRRLFDLNMNLATAKGVYNQKGNILVIETEINGFSVFMIPFYIFLIVLYTIFIGAFFATDATGSWPLIVLPFTIIHGAIMFGIPYLVMRRSTKRLQYELERELFYMTKK